MNGHLVVDLSTAVGPLARRYAATIEVLERADIDFACFGGRSVADAAIAAGADVEQLVHELQAVTAGGPDDEATLPDLVHRIITEHHNLERDVVRDLLRRLGRHASDPDAARIRRLLTSLGSAIGPHMRREERELFPLVEELALNPDRIRAGMISRRLFAEFVEHAAIHDRLEKIREIAMRLRVSRFGDGSLIDDLESFLRLAHRHVHLENNVLIPRVVELENRLRAERGAVMA